jgi:putative ABC transport system permease protein
MIKDYFKIATKNLTKKKVRSWLTLIGIFIGIATVVSIISLGQGLQQAVAQQFQILGVDRISVTAVSVAGGPPGSNILNPLTTSDLQTIQRTRGVSTASGQLIEPAIIEFNDKTRSTYVATLPRSTNERNFIMSMNNYEIVEGRMLKPDERTKVVLGINYKERPLFERNLRLGDDVLIQGQSFEVVGFMERTGSFQVDGLVLLNEEAARTLFNNMNNYAVLLAIPNNVEDIDFTADNMRNDLRKSRNVREGREDFTVATSQDILDSLNDVLSIVTYFLLAIAGISILVGGIGIMNTMFTSILERTKEIGIMKSIGARNSDILLMFLFESGLLGLMGGAIGLLLGMSLGLMVQAIGRLALGTNLIQAYFTIELIIGALLFSFLIGAIAGLLPAYRASRMNPVDALRQ